GALWKPANSLEKIANAGHIGRRPRWPSGECRFGPPSGGPAFGRRLGREKEAMKSNYKIGAAVIGSFVLGVGAASVLHAQAKPPGYVLAEIDVKDQDGYTK